MYVLYYEEFVDGYDNCYWRYTDIFYHESKEFLEKLIEDVEAYHKFKSTRLNKTSTYFSDTVIKLYRNITLN